jgi:hypothetical protein
MTVIVMLDFMKLKDKQLVKLAQFNVTNVLMLKLVLNVLVTETQELNLIAHAQVNNTQTNLELAKTVTTLAQNVSTEKHVPFVKNQELEMIVSAQLEHTMMDLPQIAHPV